MSETEKLILDKESEISSLERELAEFQTKNQYLHIPVSQKVDTSIEYSPQELVQ